MSPKFRKKVCEAIRLKKGITLDGSRRIGKTGDWMITDSHGIQKIINNELFRRDYIAVDDEAAIYLQEV
jgi:hypothetical protein